MAAVGQTACIAAKKYNRAEFHKACRHWYLNFDNSSVGFHRLHLAANRTQRRHSMQYWPVRQSGVFSSDTSTNCLEEIHSFSLLSFALRERKLDHQYRIPFANWSRKAISEASGAFPAYRPRAIEIFFRALSHFPFPSEPQGPSETFDDGSTKLALVRFDEHIRKLPR